MIVVGHYDPALVILSVVIAAVASYTSLDLAGRMRASIGRTRYVWLGAAAVAMGGGIWSMHFVAMLAFSMPMPMSYGIGLTVFSLLLPIVVAAAAFFVVGQRGAGAPQVALSGAFLGLGIAAMHYTGMAAMRMPGRVSYDPLLVGASVLIAIGAATVALRLAIQQQSLGQKLVSALAMGLAIAGMHYTGMAAVTFMAHGGPMLPAGGLEGLPQTALAIDIAVVTLLILGLAVAASIVDQQFARLTERETLALRESEERYRKALCATEQRLAGELAMARRLQDISTLLIQADDIGALYDRILDAAIALMTSDMASMQMLDQTRGELRLLAWKGFHPDSAAFWQWVRLDSPTSCGQALRASQRIIVPDTETCTLFAGAPDLDAYRKSGIRAMQSTPLVSRSGRLLGMMSTHWRKPHEPTESELRLFDVLARQAADLIERAQAEAALRELNDTLERKVEERTRALEAEAAERQKAEAALQQARRLEAIGQLTGGVAHDFNNLLTAVSGNLELLGTLAAQIEGPAAERMQRFVEGAQRAVDRGARLTQQLLAFARRQPLRPVAVDLREAFQSFSMLLKRAVGETIKLDLSLPAETCICDIDPVQFEAAILNLALNARDAMPNGGHLTIKAKNVSVVPAEARRLEIPAGDYVVVSVADSGTGMPPDVRERAFEPFFTTKDVGKGTGLGLAQVYGFAKQSGGAATLESVMGAGTRVSLYLPKARAAAARERPSAARSKPVSGHGKSVLVVEDEADVRHVIETSLRELGYRIYAAADGVEARQMLESDGAIDLLLTDVVMPNGISGIDLAREARRLRQDLKIVLISGYAGRAGGVGDEFVFLEKPFRQAELAETIAAVLDQRPR